MGMSAMAGIAHSSSAALRLHQSCCLSGWVCASAPWRHSTLQFCRPSKYSDKVSVTFDYHVPVTRYVVNHPT
ncbi:hypothetical protein PF005_g18673 [Phytophthora fragariae]|uniref:Uncharacterized protein n=1 Tax=Phytophthora fragariae TaxID=53985 RepID=A0A6A4CP67_9STRA|nr:hypothetical protein PF003_g3963 [Phytophthora fragariae]KAE8930313.1 hypothetical protein PF009_g19590 [Phytophthora fragariae]KAE8996138.1 hypothetical protein PF011_g16032 [Phytophthora fragariae]KAE9091013.1 hypothetical protein PF007_g19032 [Phytophthora fragariae]KAE9121189.1 hypothetical protein PF006_g17960 [Phytophthora fragariae]